MDQLDAPPVSEPLYTAIGAGTVRCNACGGTIMDVSIARHNHARPHIQRGEARKIIPPKRSNWPDQAAFVLVQRVGAVG